MFWPLPFLGKSPTKDLPEDSNVEDKTCRRHILTLWHLMTYIWWLMNEIPTWCHLLFYFTYYVLNMFRTLDLYMSRTTPLTSKHCILYIYSTNIGTEYFKHALYSTFFSLQNAVCFIMVTCLVPVLFKFYIQGVLKLKKKIPAPKG